MFAELKIVILERWIMSAKNTLLFKTQIFEFILQWLEKY